MKSIVGFLAAIGAAAIFAAAYWEAVRPDAGWLGSQYLFLVALPYNAASLRLTGQSNFAPDAPGELIKALAVDVALAYVAGALIEALLCAGWRVARPKRRA